MTLDKIISKIDADSFQWAVCKNASGDYTAVVAEPPSLYIGDDLSGPGCVDGATAIEALTKAFAKEVEYRAKRRAPQS